MVIYEKTLFFKIVVTIPTQIFRKLLNRNENRDNIEHRKKPRQKKGDLLWKIKGILITWNKMVVI